MGKRGLIIGAALQGLGQGVMVHAEAVRQRALRQMEIDARARSDAENRSFQAEQNRLTRENTTAEAQKTRDHQTEMQQEQIGATQFNNMSTLAAQQTMRREDNATRENIAATEAGARRGLVVSTRVDEDGNVKGVTAGGEVKDLGFKEVKKELTAEQKLFVDTAVKTSAMFDEETGRQTGVDAEKLATQLKKSKDPKIRELGEMLGTSEDPEAAAAELMAGIAEARDTNAASAEAGEPTPSANRGLTPPKEAKEGKDAGMGSRGNPHKPMSDEDFQKIPAGEFYIDPDDNKIYRKN